MATNFESYFPFDAGPGANAAEDQWRDMARHWLADGPIRGILDELEPFGDSTGMQVKVRAGHVWLAGHLGKKSTETILPVGANSSGFTRHDRIVARADFTNNRVELDIIQGVPSGTPVTPPLTQSASIWEISLGTIIITNGAVTIAAGDVFDTRQLQSAAGARGELGYDDLDADSASTSGTTILDIGPTVTVRGLTGRKLKVTIGWERVNPTTADSQFEVLIRDGNNTVIRRVRVAGESSTAAKDGGQCSARLVPAAEVATYKFSFVRAVGTGTGNVEANPDSPAYILVEDIGPA